MVFKILDILRNEGVGHALGGPPRVPRSMSLNAPYIKEQEYIWLCDGILTVCNLTFSHINAYVTKFDLGIK